MSEKTDLWGEIEEDADLVPPSTILKEQAALLEEKTRGRLEGELRTRKVNEGSDLAFEFYIVAPYLNRYSAKVLGLRYPITLYPVTVGDFFENTVFEARNQAEFMEIVRGILQSAPVKRIVAALLAQSDETS